MCKATQTLSHSTWNNDDILSILDHVDCLLHIDLRVGTNDLHGFARAGGWGAVASEDDIRQGAVHGLARIKYKVRNKTKKQKKRNT